MIIKAEYEEVGKEGIIRIWPAPVTEAEGKELDTAVLECANRTSNYEELEDENIRLTQRIDNEEESHQETQNSLDRVETDIRDALDMEDLVQIKAHLEEILREHF